MSVLLDQSLSNGLGEVEGAPSAGVADRTRDLVDDVLVDGVEQLELSVLGAVHHRGAVRVEQSVNDELLQDDITLHYFSSLCVE